MKTIGLKAVKRLLGSPDKPIRCEFMTSDGIENIGARNLLHAKQIVMDWRAGSKFRIIDNKTGVIYFKGKTGLYCFGGGTASVISSFERKVESQYGSAGEPVRYTPSVSDGLVRNAKARVKQLDKYNENRALNLVRARAWRDKIAGKDNVDGFDLKNLRAIWKQREQIFRDRFARKLYDGRNSANVEVVL